MKDRVVRSIALHDEVRVFCTIMTETVSEAQRRHNTSPVATAALGRALVATSLIGMTLKNNETVTVRIQGGGPLGTIVTNGNGAIAVRGYVQNPHIDLPLNPSGKLDVGKAVGKEGYLYVTKDLHLKEPYTSSVPLVSGELGDDFTYYFFHSEQTPSVVALGVLIEKDWHVSAAGGFLVQVLPHASENTINYLEKIVHDIPPVTKMICDGLTEEKIIENIFGSEVNFLEEKRVCFACPCSRQRLEELLISLGKQNLEEILHEEGKAELRCHFCNEVYHFERDDLEKLLREILQREEKEKYKK